MSAPVTELYLVRHGETDWNRARRLQGILDTPLNSVGVSQARHLADRFRSQTVSAVVTSPLSRAQHTARQIARRTRAAFVVDPLLAEIDHGAWTGLTIPAIARACTDAVIGDHLQPDALDVSDGETLVAAYRRASAVLRRLVAAPAPASLVIVSHGVINALLTCAAVGRAPARINEYPQPNGCTYRLRFRRGVLVTIECTSLPDPVTHGSVQQGEAL
jgi:broad specificity phosphatase PhoE